MRLLCAVLALGASCLAGPADAQDSPINSPLASAMIDRTVFRDGEVARSQEVHGAWTLLCDAIPRLGRRFCSLRSAPVRIGDAQIDLTVSTGDDGRPAALLRVPFGLALAAGVVVSGNPANRAPPRHVPIALCDHAGCEAVWTLAGPELGSLRDGKPLHLTLQGWTAARLFGGSPARPFVVAVPGSGFPEALAASLR